MGQVTEILPTKNFLTWVSSQFNPENYFKCFYYMEGYLDFNGILAFATRSLVHAE